MDVESSGRKSGSAVGQRDLPNGQLENGPLGLEAIADVGNALNVVSKETKLLAERIDMLIQGVGSNWLPIRGNGCRNLLACVGAVGCFGKEREDAILNLIQPNRLAPEFHPIGPPAGSLDMPNGNLLVPDGQAANFDGFRLE